MFVTYSCRFEVYTKSVASTRFEERFDFFFVAFWWFDEDHHIKDSEPLNF